MKKGYMECPYCANEIKIGAKKCQFCKEFLDLGNKKLGEDVVVDKKSFFYKFFRRDLNLSKKWWHRLFKICFFILLFFLPLKWTYNQLIDMSDYYWMEYIDTVENRIGNNVVRVGSLMNSSEHIDHFYTSKGLLPGIGGGIKIGDLTQHYVEYGFDTMEDTYKSLYCSKQWDTDKLLALTRESNAWYRSLSDGRRGQPTLGQVLDEIQEYNCVLIDTIEGEKFLNHQFTSLDDLFILKVTSKSKWRGFWWRFGEHYLLYQFLILIPGLLIVLIYYKIVVYIIYGGSKKKN